MKPTTKKFIFIKDRAMFKFSLSVPFLGGSEHAMWILRQCVTVFFTVFCLTRNSGFPNQRNYAEIDLIYEPT